MEFHESGRQMESEVRSAEMSRSIAARAWIVSPTFDLLLLANLAWPLLLLPGFATSSSTAIDFWQIYYLTLPHRWITLILVAMDTDRRAGRQRALLGVAVLAALVVVGVYFGTGAFLCLALVDYVWNAWHFASQHAGVLRMYSRKVGDGLPGLERWGLRAFVTYGALRAAGWATGMFEADSPWLTTLHALDFAILGVPIVLLGSVLTSYRPVLLGKLAYLASVCVLYTGFILCLHFDVARGIVIFAAAGSMFHAVEYLAIVTHYARRRGSVGSDGLFRSLARSWLGFLIVYIVLLGSLGVWLSRPDSKLFLLWQGLNLWAAFVHYAFDGLIWKLRQPQTAAALGVAGP